MEELESLTREVEKWISQPDHFAQEGLQGFSETGLKVTTVINITMRVH